MGDQFNMRDNIAGAVGRGASVTARDIATYKSEVEQSTHIDADLKQKLAKAGEEVERSDLSESDKQDATENLRELTAELDKPNRHPGLVRRYWNRVKEVRNVGVTVHEAYLSVPRGTLVNRLVTIHRRYAAFIQLQAIHDFRL